MNKEDFLTLTSLRLAEMIDEMKSLILSIADEYAEALNNLECLEDMEEVVKSELVCKYIDRGKRYNESLRRAECSDDFKMYKQKIVSAREILNPLQIRHRAFSHIIDAITSLAYVKNSEIKRGL